MRGPQHGLGPLPIAILSKNVDHIDVLASNHEEDNELYFSVINIDLETFIACRSTDEAERRPTGFARYGAIATLPQRIAGVSSVHFATIVRSIGFMESTPQI